MDRQELAVLLSEAEPDQRRTLIEQHAPLVDVGLARALKAVCYEAFNTNPPRAVAAAEATAAVAQAVHDPEADALTAWTAGIAALVGGRMEEAGQHLDEAETGFLALGKEHDAASTRVSKVYALAMLGRYDEAIECGLYARDLFLAHGDGAAAGRVEQNLGNLYARRDRYRDAEQLHRAARSRFALLGDEQHLAQAENGLANALLWQHQFRAAAELYEQGLARAEAAGLERTAAEIENNIGVLALFQGQYDRALDFLERCRRRYAVLGMEHQAAHAERYLADAYLELNLAPEAAATYERLIPIFAGLGLRYDQAWVQAHLGRARSMLGEAEAARAAFAEARALYAAEGNAVGEALVALFEAQFQYEQGDFEASAVEATAADMTFTAVGTRSRALLARWLRGEALRAAGRWEESREVIEATLAEAARDGVPQVMQRCHVTAGLLAASRDSARAEESFKQAVTLLEDLRAPLPAEEFRTAFVADKLTPYAELVRLCLADRGSDRAIEALEYVERAKSRALVDLLQGAVPIDRQPRDGFEEGLVERLQQLREELNWYYSHLNQPSDAKTEDGRAADLAVAVREREQAIAEINRQLQQCSAGVPGQVRPTTIADVQQRLGNDTAFVEYFTVGDELLAFIVTEDGVAVERALGERPAVEATVERLRFQIGTLRFGGRRVEAHMTQLTERIRHYLGELYDILVRPIEGRLAHERLVIAPYGALHSVPFHALYDGSGYLIERREVLYAPSAAVLGHCLGIAERPLRRAVLLGVPDAETPRVRDEVIALAPLFPEATVLLDEEATVAALRRSAPTADVLHLACHGQFRPDNPLFSSLRLADGWLTAREAYGLDLRGALVTLSACETGVSVVAPGDELLGLVRGFLSAGAPSLLVSLWVVDDDSTAALMTEFYRRLCAGDRPAAALRHAQRSLLQERSHPFFWSPFALFGRW
jgi:CHAT domain-containing protein